MPRSIKSKLASVLPWYSSLTPNKAEQLQVNWIYPNPDTMVITFGSKSKQIPQNRLSFSFTHTHPHIHTWPHSQKRAKTRQSLAGRAKKLAWRLNFFCSAGVTGFGA